MQHIFHKEANQDVIDQVHKEFFLKPCRYFVELFKKEKEKENFERGRHRSSIHWSSVRMPAQPELGQDEVRDQELSPGLLLGGQEHSLLVITSCFPEYTPSNRKLELEAEPGYGMCHSNLHVNWLLITVNKRQKNREFVGVPVYCTAAFFRFQIMGRDSAPLKPCPGSRVDMHKCTFVA